MSKTEIPHVDRVIHLEERVGISLEGVYAEFELVGDDSKYVNVLGEIVSRDGSDLEDDIYITMTAYNAENKVIARGQEVIYAGGFLGLASFKMAERVIEMPTRIRIYPET